MLLKCFCDEGPRASEVLFAVFGEKRRERALFQEGTALIVFGSELFDLPLVNIVGIPVISGQKIDFEAPENMRLPRLVFLICGRHGCGEDVLLLMIVADAPESVEIFGATAGQNFSAPKTG